MINVQPEAEPRIREVRGRLTSNTQRGLIAALEFLSRSVKGSQRPTFTIEPFDDDAWELHFDEFATPDLGRFSTGLLGVPGVTVHDLASSLPSEIDS